MFVYFENWIICIFDLLQQAHHHHQPTTVLGPQHMPALATLQLQILVLDQVSGLEQPPVDC